MSEHWWVTTGDWHDPLMKKIIGPFESRELALDVRRYVEIVRHTDQLWVQQDPAVSS